MSEKEKHSEKLRRLIHNDLKEFMKELLEDTAFDVQGKIAIGGPFSNALKQLETCVEILERFEPAEAAPA